MGTDSEMTYSVLMAVYGKESPEFFRQSIESMLASDSTVFGFCSCLRWTIAPGVK